MPANPYAVETRAQGALILTSSQGLGEAIRHELATFSLDPLVVVKGEVAASSMTADLSAYLADHDLDYVIVVMTESLRTWLEGEGSALWGQIQEASRGGNVVIAVPIWQPDLGVTFPGARLVYLGEYIENTGESAPTLNHFVAEAQGRGTITLPEDGVIAYSLLSPVDVAVSLARLVTSPTWKEREVIVASPETISLLSLAHTIAAAAPRQVKIIFGGSNPILSPVYDWKKILLSHAEYGIVLSGVITESLTQYLAEPPQPAPSRAAPLPEPPRPRLAPLERPQPPVEQMKVAEPTHPKPRLSDQSLVFVPLHESGRRARLHESLTKVKAWRPRPRTRAAHPIRNIIVRGLVIALGLYIGSLAFVTTIVALHLRSLAPLAQSGDISRLRVSPLTKYSAIYLEANVVAFSSVPPLKNNAGVSETKVLLNAYTQTLGVLETTRELSLATKNISSYVLGSSGGDIASSLSNARLYSEELYEKLSLLEASLPDEVPAILQKYRAEYGTFKTTLGTFKKNLITGKALLAVAPDFIALGGRAKYAVLFQNNMELRATGGFIGSFAVLSFENGRLYDMPVYDVYAADGQLKGHVEPPLPIKEILGEANWYLRDSNFDPDFPTSARRAEWFIKKTMNTDVNGTIAITLDLLKSLLHATGPLELPDYAESVSESNVYERAQYHAEVNFFPGSQAKKEFLSSVADALFAKLQSGEGQDPLRLVQALASAVESKNVLISALDPGVEHVMSTLSWNGELVDHPCPGSAGCVKDYAYLVDSNFGVNKANYYVTRDLSVVTTVTKEGSLGHVFTARYKNSATSTAWPAGAYKNYARLYLPFGSQIESVKVGEKTLTGSELTQTQEHDKLAVAFLFTVPINTELNVEVRYATPEVIKSGALYTWYWQKQPGTGVAEPLSVTLNYPLFLKPEVISPQAELTPQQLHFDFLNDADHRVTVKFAQ